MTGPACQSCSYQFTPKSRVWLTDAGQLCGRCAIDNRVHDKLFPDCRELWHKPTSHTHRIVRARNLGTAVPKEKKITVTERHEFR